MESVILIGSSGHASVIADAIERQDRYRIAGCVDSFRGPGSTHFGYPVFGPETCLPELVSQYNLSGAVIAIGDNWNRARMAARVRELTTLSFPAIIHPAAQIARTAKVEEGSVIFANAVVNSGARVGRQCILNTASTLDHDSELNDFASLAPGSTIGGKTRIGSYSAICLGARVIHGISVGEHTVVGAGAVVLRDTPDFVVAYGNPSKVIRARKPGDAYL